MSIVAVVIAVSVIGWAVTMMLLSLSATRPSGLGVREGRLAACPGTPNCVCSEDEGDSAIAPLTYEGDAAEAWQRLQSVLTRYPRTRLMSVTDDYIHAECTSLLFRFVDDVEFRLDAVEKKIHFRSKSRAGRSDLGVNQARMETIREMFGKR